MLLSRLKTVDLPVQQHLIMRVAETSKDIYCSATHKSYARRLAELTNEVARKMKV